MSQKCIQRLFLEVLHFARLYEMSACFGVLHLCVRRHVDGVGKSYAFGRAKNTLGETVIRADVTPHCYAKQSLKLPANENLASNAATLPGSATRRQVYTHFGKCSPNLGLCRAFVKERKSVSGGTLPLRGRRPTSLQMAPHLSPDSHPFGDGPSH